MTQVAEKEQTFPVNPRRIVEDPEFIREWKQFVSSRQNELTLRCAHYALYVALKGKNWTNSFSPICNKKKIDNGMLPARGAIMVMGELIQADRMDDILRRNLELKGEFTEDKFYELSRVADLLRPFSGAVTEADFLKIREIMNEDYNAFLRSLT